MPAKFIKGIPPYLSNQKSAEVWFALSDGTVRMGHVNYYFDKDKLHSITVEGDDGFGVGLFAQDIRCLTGVKIIGYTPVKKPSFPGNL